MPYVQRDTKGNISGMFANSQAGYAEEFLDEHNPEVVAFRMAHPMPDDLRKPPTEEEVKRQIEDHERVKKEHAELTKAIWAFNSSFHNLEIALSALLYEAIHTEPRSSHIAYAVYYSPDGFHGRIALVDNVIKQLIIENNALSELSNHWKTIFDKFGKIRAVRNKIAHGMPSTMNIRGKNHVRLTSPAFDVNRVGRPLAATGDPPGLNTADITTAASTLRWLAERVDDVNGIIDAFHQNVPQALSEKFDALKVGLQTVHNQ